MKAVIQRPVGARAWRRSINDSLGPVKHGSTPLTRGWLSIGFSGVNDDFARELAGPDHLHDAFGPAATHGQHDDRAEIGCLLEGMSSTTAWNRVAVRLHEAFLPIPRERVGNGAASSRKKRNRY